MNERDTKEYEAFVEKQQKLLDRMIYKFTQVLLLMGIAQETVTKIVAEYDFHETFWKFSNAEKTKEMILPAAQVSALKGIILAISNMALGINCDLVIYGYNDRGPLVNFTTETKKTLKGLMGQIASVWERNVSES